MTSPFQIGSKENFIKSLQREVAGGLSIRDTVEIENMFKELKSADPRSLPSRYWEELNKMNISQLQENGYDNFKRTVALNYFTWTRLMPWDSQLIFLLKNLSIRDILLSLWNALNAERHDFFGGIFNPIQSFWYNFLTLMLWQYLFALPLPMAFYELREPREGNPCIVRPLPSMAVSQDLANSLLEINAFWNYLPKDRPITILELGGGYGRSAYALLNLLPNAKFYAVDIPPALWIQKRYLTNQCREQDIKFMLPPGLDSIAPQSVDFIYSISSLHEMRQDQINYYFKVFNRLLKPGGYFYLKQWKEGKVLFENVTILESDYPIPPQWQRIFSRNARIQTRFFEALYQKKQ